jgi:hypothetical protein
MKPEEQRIAIAQSCGWLPYSTDKVDLSARYFDKGPWWRNAEACEIASINQLPDYLNDLNAMHEAEKALTNEHYVMYHVQLRSLTKNTEITSAFTTLHATARQRAAALLKTLNPWKA